MFDIGWSEMMVIGVLGLIVVGPKDLPKVIQTIVQAVQYVRNLSGEFYKQIEEVGKETGLSELKDQADALKSGNLDGFLENQVDPDGDLRRMIEAEPDTHKIAPALKDHPSVTADEAALADIEPEASDAPKMPKAASDGSDLPEPIYDHSLFLDPSRKAEAEQYEAAFAARVTPVPNSDQDAIGQQPETTPAAEEAKVKADKS